MLSIEGKKNRYGFKSEGTECHYPFREVTRGWSPLSWDSRMGTKWKLSLLPVRKERADVWHVPEDPQNCLDM